MIPTSKTACSWSVKLFLLHLLMATTTAGGREFLPSAGRASSHEHLQLLVQPAHKPPTCRKTLDSSAISDQVVKMSAVQIGSHPPSCENKCNVCNPCNAVQMPTPEGHQSQQLGHSLPRDNLQFDTEETNYNPESWKCKCGNSFFNP